MFTIGMNILITSRGPLPRALHILAHIMTATMMFAIGMKNSLIIHDRHLGHLEHANELHDCYPDQDAGVHPALLTNALGAKAVEQVSRPTDDLGTPASS